MALTGLFLCTFLVGHLLGNLQLILKTGEEGRRAFNEYAYFMGHNPFIELLSYVTYAAVLIHVIDGFALTIQNRKARPVRYAHNKPGANSSSASRSMAILGTLILVFLATHMANFWWKMKFSSDPMPLHQVVVANPQSGAEETFYITHTGDYVPTSAFVGEGEMPAAMEVRNGTEFYLKEVNLKRGEGYKDLHSVVLSRLPCFLNHMCFPLDL